MAKENDLLSNPDKNVEDVIEDLENKQNGNVTQCSLTDIENIVKELLDSLPKVNRNNIRKEMEDMIVPIQKNPTTYDINKGLALSQGYRDRLAEIYLLAQKEFKIRKRCLDMLFDAINLISKASSNDKRRGEATMKYPIMLIQTEAAEIFQKEVEQIYNNMKSTSDSISRQVSVMQLQIQLGEVRRQESPNSPAEENVSNKSGQLKAWNEL